MLRVEDGNHGEYRPRRHEFVPSGVSFIRAADLAGGSVDFSGAERINDEALGRIRKGIGAPGDVLLSHKGTVGRIALVPLDAPPFVCSPQTTFWRSLDTDRIDRRFLRFFLESPDFVDQLRSRKGETDMADYVSLTEQRKLELVLPAIQVQRAIAAVLGALDEKAESNRRQIKAADSIADLRFLQLSVGAGTRRVGDLISDGALFLSDGYRTRADQLGAPGVPILRVADMRAGHFDTPTGDHIRVELHSRYAEKCSCTDDVVVTTKGTVGRVALVRSTDPGVVYSPQLCFFRVLDASVVSAAIVHRWVRSDAFRAQALTVQGQTDMAAYVNLGDLAQFELPEIDASNPVVGEIRDLDALLEHKRRETRELKFLRDVLLPELLSGRLRVKDAEKVAEEVT